MNHDATEARLRELAWKRELTSAEQEELRAWLATRPDAREDWEAETQLSNVLDRLPEATVSSNFTARVMQAVEREVLTRRSQPKLNRVWRSLLPRAATALVIACAGFYAWKRHETAQTAGLADSLVAVSQVQALPSVDSLENFDAIRRLGRTPPVDEELLALMQ